MSLERTLEGDYMASAGSREHWAALEQRVTGLESGVRDIATAVRSLSDKMDTRSITPWALIASFGLLLLAVLGMVGKLAYDPIKDAQLRQEAMIEKYVERSEATDKRIVDRVYENDRALRGFIVPRAEHEIATALVQKSIDALATRIDRLETRTRP